MSNPPCERRAGESEYDYLKRLIYEEVHAEGADRSSYSNMSSLIDANRVLQKRLTSVSLAGSTKEVSDCMRLVRLRLVQAFIQMLKLSEVCQLPFDRLVSDSAAYLSPLDDPLELLP